MGKDFTSLALLLSGLLLLGGRSLGIFRGSVRSICGRLASFDLLARGCELTEEGIASLALLFSASFCSAAKAWAVCKAFSASVRASVRAVTRAVKVPTSSRADAS